MKKRILAMLIALSMVFSLLPTSLVSFAADETITDTNFTVTGGIEQGDLTEESYDYIYSTESDTLYICSDTTLTIKGASTDTIVVNANVTANLIFDNVTIGESDGNWGSVISFADDTSEGATITIKGDTIINGYYVVSSSSYSTDCAITFIVEEDASLLINSAEFASGCVDFTIENKGDVTVMPRASLSYTGSALTLTNEAGASMFLTQGASVTNGTLSITNAGDFTAYSAGDDAIGVTGSLSISSTAGSFTAATDSRYDEALSLEEGYNYISKTEGGADYYNYDYFYNYDISFTGGDVNLWAEATFDADTGAAIAPVLTTSSGSYSSSAVLFEVEQKRESSSSEYNGTTTYYNYTMTSDVRDFYIGGTANVSAISGGHGIVLNEVGNTSTTYYTYLDSTEYFNKLATETITVEGDATLVAYGAYRSATVVGLGSEEDMHYSDGRTITLAGNAVVTLAQAEKATYFDFNDYDYLGFLGGGDNSGSTIVLKENAALYSALGIGSSSYSSTKTGYDGGTIQILDNASIGLAVTTSDGSNFVTGGIEYDYSSSYRPLGGTIGGSSGYLGAGDGGDITIDTTGLVVAYSIGGGSLDASSAVYYLADGETVVSAGDGGNITIKNGVFYVQHIGGGYVYDTSSNTSSSYTLSSDVTVKGGDGGNITITGGDFSATASTYGTLVNDPLGGIVSNQTDVYYASAAIGGGGAYSENGTAIAGDGGTIYFAPDGDVSCELPVAYNSIYNSSSGVAYSAAVIGGGYAQSGDVPSGGNGGTITIASGSIDTGVHYWDGDDGNVGAMVGGAYMGGSGNITITGGHIQGNAAIIVGAGTGATDANGSLIITGGSMYTYEGTINATPTNADGELVYEVAAIYDYNYDELLSLSLVDADGNAYAYGTQDSKLGYSFWLPVDTDAVDKSESYLAYTVTYKTRTDNTITEYVKAIYASSDYECISDKYVDGYTTDWEAIYADDAYAPGVNYQPDNWTLKSYTDSSGETQYYYSYNGDYADIEPNDSAPGVNYNPDDWAYTLRFYASDISSQEVIMGMQLSSDWGNGSKQYTGEALTPTFTVMSNFGDELVEDVDYTLTIEWAGFIGGYNTWTVVDEVLNHGAYVVTATGIGEYEGYTSVIDEDEIFVNPAYVYVEPAEGITITKEYDGTTTVLGADGNAIESIALQLCDDSAVVATDAISNLVLKDLYYTQSSIGTGIGISGNLSFDGNENYNYSIYTYYLAEDNETTVYTVTGDITVKVLSETAIDTSNITISKVYDGTTSLSMSNVSGDLLLTDLVGTEIATIAYTAVSPLASANVGADNSVTLTLSDLSGANSGNYALANDASTVTVTSGITITPADYSYTLTAAQQAQEFTQGGGIAQISVPQVATGVNSETVTGTAALYIDEACTTLATDDNTNAWEVGEHNLYIAFTPDASETNYTDKVTTGNVVVVTVLEGAAQEITFASGDVTATYGDAATANAASNTSENGGAISYASSNASVASVDAATGEITLGNVGTATITATAATVEGVYRETSVSYQITVTAKEITITVNDQTKAFGDAVPSLTYAEITGLVGNDTAADLGIVLSTTADESAVVGEYAINATASNANYDITVEPGILTVAQAAAPTLDDVAYSIVYGNAYTSESITLSAMPEDAGETVYAVNDITDAYGIYTADSASIAGNVLTFDTTADGQLDESFTISVTVTSKNYQDTTFAVTVTLVDKYTVAITGLTLESKEYDGAVLATAGTVSGSYSANGVEADYLNGYTYTWDTTDGAAPTNVGTYSLTVSVAETNFYQGSVTFENIAITPKAVTLKPADISMYNTADLPTSFTLIAVGLVDGDTITSTGEAPSFVLMDGEEELTTVANGSYTILWENKDAVDFADDNYTFTKADGTLTISSKPSSSTSSGSSSTDVTVTEDVVVEETDTVTTVSPAVEPEEEEDVVESTTTTTTTESATEEATTEETGSESDTTGETVVSVAVEAATEGTVATASVDEAAMETAVAQALAAAEETDTAPVVELAVDMPADAESVSVTLATETLAALAAHPDATLTLTTSVGTITLDSATIAGLVAAADGAELRMEITPVATTTLNETQQSVVGDAPVYDLSVYLGDEYIANFEGEVVVALPYTLKDGETADGVQVYYLDDMGNIEEMETTYDSLTGHACFTTTHFSVYVVSHQSSVTSSMPVLPMVVGTVLALGLVAVLLVFLRKREQQQED